MLKKMRPLLIIVVVLAILLGVVGNQPQSVSADGGACARTHVVAQGQNLFRIGLMYGVRWDILQAWNGLPNPNLIYVGQVLCVSGPSGTIPPVITPPGGSGTVYPGNPFGPTSQPRVYFPQITLGQTFQLSGYNFPRNSQVTISMAPLGSQYLYTAYYTATTDANGRFIVSVTIPDALKSSPTVAVLTTANGGYWAKNWFYNR